MLFQKLEDYLTNTDLRQLKEASQILSDRYRGGFKGRFADSLLLKKAYVATRMPATFQAISKVFEEAKKRGFFPKTLLDVGSGPGTAIWSALEHFSVEKFTLVEQDPDFIQISKDLLQGLNYQFVFERQKLQDYSAIQHDMIVFSYSIGEVPKDQLEPIIDNYWKATNNSLIIIEPGTPKGFETLLEARKILISKGAFLVAPCPHHHICSLRQQPETSTDWCHFSARVDRSFFHRYAKDASLSYEDEKFCYLIASKTNSKTTSQRILKPPIKRSGHIIFNLCAPDGLKNSTVSKKGGELYKIAKKLDWGDDFG